MFSAQVNEMGGGEVAEGRGMGESSIELVYFAKAWHLKIREISRLWHVASFASFPTKLRLCPSCYQNAFASEAPRRENVLVCPALTKTAIIVQTAVTLIPLMQKYSDSSTVWTILRVRRQWEKFSDTRWQLEKFADSNDANAKAERNWKWKMTREAREGLLK